MIDNLRRNVLTIGDIFSVALVTPNASRNMVQIEFFKIFSRFRFGADAVDNVQ